MFECPNRTNHNRANVDESIRNEFVYWMPSNWLILPWHAFSESETIERAYLIQLDPCDCFWDETEDDDEDEDI